MLVATRFDADSVQDTGMPSLDVLAARLSEQLGVEAFLPDECVGDAVVRVLHQLRPAQISVLPDLARERGEQSNDERFARALAHDADAYLGEAFASSHLEQASLVRVPQLLPRRALGAAEAQELGLLTEHVSAPRAAIGWCAGGRQLSAKLDLLDTWLPRLGTLCAGGELATTLLVAVGRAGGVELGAGARREGALVSGARARSRRRAALAQRSAGRLGRRPRAARRCTPRARSDFRVIDVGPESAERFCQALGARRHLLWWGPLGALESEAGASSSLRLAQLCARPELRSIVLGKDTTVGPRSFQPSSSCAYRRKVVYGMLTPSRTSSSWTRIRVSGGSSWSQLSIRARCWSSTSRISDGSGAGRS